MTVVLIIAGFGCLLLAGLTSGTGWTPAVAVVSAFAAACFLFALAAGAFS